MVAAVTLANFPTLKKLPARMRLKIAEELWDSAVGDNLPVPASHKSVIRSRRAAYERGEMGTVTMETLKRSIRRRA
jgi:putative addiction module component (TIGR02574 family)